MEKSEVRYTFSMRLQILTAVAFVTTLSSSAMAQSAVLDTSMGRINCRRFGDEKRGTAVVFVGGAKGRN